MLRLCGDPDLVERLGRAGRRFAESLSWEHAAEQTEAHLLETVSKE
jgi:glycosyltransferase involved in cell wall biosynthesis